MDKKERGFFKNLIEMPLHWKIVLLSVLGYGLGATFVFIDVIMK